MCSSAFAFVGHGQFRNSHFTFGFATCSQFDYCMRHMVYQELCASVECMINLPALNYLLLVKITKPPHCCLSFHTSQSPEAWCFDPCVHDTQRIHLSFSYEPSSESHAESHSESHTESHTESSPPNVFSNGQWMHESHSDFNRQNLCDHQPST